jgi:outer membrane receptor protein involved in Fe transport
MHKSLKRTLITGTALAALATAAAAEQFNIPAGDLKTALDVYARQTGTQLLVSTDAVKGVRTHGVQGDMGADAALSHLLSGTGFKSINTAPGTVGLVPAGASSQAVAVEPLQLAQAAPAPRAVETVTVTSSKLGGADVQSIPIAITALSQEQLTATQTNGGPDLVKQVPNLTFTKTNFSGYSIQIRGIGTQAISVTTDPAVAVAMNDTPFIRNHFFEQEFFDVGQVEVLRGPQGTLYGRNATAGVVNLVPAKPIDQFEAMASAELGNYHQRRFEGMLNIPIVDDRLDIRLAGEWTKRQGYSFNENTDQRIDGRDLWSGRATIGFKPIENLQMYLVWEHFSENDDRMRSAKQLCKTDPTPTEIGGIVIPPDAGGYAGKTSYVSQGCDPASLYSPDSFQVPNGYALPYYGATAGYGNSVFTHLNPYAGATQSTNLRVIETLLNPVYKVKNDIVEFNVDYNVTPQFTFVSQTGFNHDFLWSTEDYNRFNTVPGVFDPTNGRSIVEGILSPDGVFCDPQLGCSDRLVAQDLVKAQSWQASQEFRLESHFSGPFNFSVGGNYLHYETHENYYVFINSLSMFVAKMGADGTSGPVAGHRPYVPNVTDNSDCLRGGKSPGDPGIGYPILGCVYMDPHPLDSVDDTGHNYFLSQNPYVLNSYAGFGEASYNVFKDLKLTAGLRWTEDRKHFPIIPSWLLAANSYGYPVAKVIDQQWDELTGRAVANWTPQLDFTDQTLVYASYAHGYKAGGANPPLPVIVGPGNAGDDTGILDGTAGHPEVFKPEFIDAFELGTKNTLLDGALTFNASAFYYNYENYQISEIVDRTSINLNFDAHVKGAEVEATYEPIPGLRFNFSGGYEDARLANGDKAVDLMDRTAGNSDWIVIKPFVTNPTNCVIPVYMYAARNGNITDACQSWYLPDALAGHIDPLTRLTYTPNPSVKAVPDGTGGVAIQPLNIPGYIGYDPTTAPNNGEGFYKDLSHNQMPNAPPFTVSFGAQYSMPLSSDWAGTLRGDFYWQSDSFWRVFNDLDYDRLHGYKNVNLTLILTNQAGWQVMLYDKNVFNTTAITGAFLNSDDSGLTTNVFLTDPKLIGIRVTKNW